MGHMNSRGGDDQKKFHRNDQRESRRIHVNLEAELHVEGRKYSVLIANLSKTGLHVILPVPPGTSVSLASMTDADLTVRIDSTESIELSCKKLWSTEIPESPLVQRVGLLIKNPPPSYTTFYKHLSYQERTEVTRRPIAVIGLACYYPGASDIQQLWENVVTRRRQFRRIPEVRLPLDEYYDPDPAAEDKTYGTKAAVIDGFSFDWIKRGIPKSVVDSTDISHWLALETALQAVKDAGYRSAKVPPDRTGVILGNTLTGEQSRAENMRLRWPFVLKTLQAAAADNGLSPEMITALATNMEAYYKSVFAPVTEDTLAGNLSNTIAGRICNFLNLNGGGYTVDGACSSSLIAVATACTGLSDGNLDLAIVGGVDVSLDTFELIGFAKTKALARDDMRVYDRRASGFIPGEGAGFAVLKRLEDARADGDYIYAILRGWGMSTDGKGGLTAPKAEAQALAIRRAYTGAGYALRDVDFIEGHGTGTPAGDKAELTAIAEVLGDMQSHSLRPCGITSLKSIIGHTKAASGIGGFIKAVMAVNRRVLPPTANCTEPSPTFENPARLVYPITQGEIRPPQEVLRAGVSGMGFGGINCHLTIESGDAPAAKLAPNMEERQLLASAQETELFIFSADSSAELLTRVREVRQAAQGMSVGDMVDLAAQLSREVEGQDLVRAALIADSPESLAEELEELENSLVQAPPVAGEKRINSKQNLLIGHTLQKTKIGFLFPGQGSQQLNMARTLVERHEWAREFTAGASAWLQEETGIDVVSHLHKPLDRALDHTLVEGWAEELKATEIAQPAICLASLLCYKRLARLGITPVAAGGHSLGELTAFHVAGAFDEEALLKLAAIRGQAMTAAQDARGSMASLACDYETAAAILGQVQGYVVAANINSPQQVVISGESEAVEQAVAMAQAKGIDTRMLQVSNAFHSKFVAGAADRLRSSAPVPKLLGKLQMKLFTGLGGTEAKAGLSLHDHFADQVVSQVDFISIVRGLAGECDLLLEVGPGRVLSGLARTIIGDQGPLCLPVESKPGRDRDLNLCLAHIFILGGEIRWDALYEDRLVRPFVPASARAFIVNPCERPLKLPQSVAPKTVPSGAAPLHSALAAATSIDPQVLSEYLMRRGPFLSAVIRADMENLSLGSQPPQNEAEDSIDNVPGLPPTDKETSVTLKGQDDAISITDLVLELIEKRTGFPVSSLTLEMRLRDDLNLDSIKVGELVIVLSRHLKLSTSLDPETFANASIAELIAALRKSAPSLPNQDYAKSANQSPRKRLNTVQEIRTFLIQETEAPIEAESLRRVEEGAQALIIGDPFSTKNRALHAQLLKLGMEAKLINVTDAIDHLVGEDDLSVMIMILPQADTSFWTCDPEEFDQRTENVAAQFFDIFTRLLANRHSLANLRCLVIHPKSSADIALEIDGCAAFFKTVRLEYPEADLKWINLPESWSARQWAEVLITELERQGKRIWFSYDENGLRRTDVAVLPSRRKNDAIVLDRKDVMLASGGARGITFELALAMARKHGVKLALIGSSPMPDSNGDDELEMATNFQRLKKEGLKFVYFQCDVTDSEVVDATVSEIQKELGSISIILHGAGFTRPAPLIGMRREEYLKCIRVKTRGLYNLLRAVPVADLKGLHVLSSVLGRTGMQGQADYTLANGWLDGAVASFAQSYPGVQCFSIGYSIWSETGLGKRMGLVDSLAGSGIVPVDNRHGIEAYLELVQGSFQGTTFVVTGPLTPELDQNLFLQSSHGMSRFLERTVSHTPNQEIVVEATISHRKDLYLAEHVFQGTPVMPGVMAVEAMVEAAAACMGINRSPDRLERIHFVRPLIVPENTQTIVRIQGRVVECDPSCIRIEAVLRSEEGGSDKVHFRLECLFGATEKPSPKAIDPASIPGPLPIDLSDFEPVPLFQGKLFRVIRSLRQLKIGAGSITEIKVPQRERYFRAASELRCITRSPAVRDAVLQSAGLSLPEMCLPVSIDSIEFYGRAEPGNSIFCISQIVSVKDHSYTVDISLFNADGKPLEALEGVIFSATRAVAPLTKEIQVCALPISAARKHLFPGENRSPYALCAVGHEEIKNNPSLEITSRDFEQINAGISPARRDAALVGLVAVRRAVVDYAKRHLGLQISGTSISVRHWQDGKPELEFQDDSIAAAFSGIELSLTDCGKLSAALLGPAPLGIDLERVENRDAETWRGLLGDDGYDLALRLGNSVPEPFDHAATRVWTLIEAGKKAFSLERIIPSYEGSPDPYVRMFKVKGDSLPAEFQSIALDFGGDARDAGILSFAMGNVSSLWENTAPPTHGKRAPADNLHEVNERFLEQLSRLARLCVDDPDHPETENHHRAYDKLSEQMLSDLKRLSQGMGSAEKRQLQLRCSGNLLKFLQRERVSSESFRRALEKPLGYPGDYLLMDLILQNRVNTKGLGYHLDRKFLNRSGAEGVRQRTYWAVEQIGKWLTAAGKKDFTLLDLGCGPMTIEKMVAEKYQNSGIAFTFLGLDIDLKVMSFTQNRFADFSRISLETRKCNLLSPAGLAEIALLAPRADLTITMGFFDYLDPTTIIAFLETLRTASREETGILFANYQSDHESRLSMEWLLDWWLIYKTPEEMAAICRAAGFLDEQTRIQLDGSESVLLVEARKRKLGKNVTSLGGRRNPATAFLRSIEN